MLNANDCYKVFLQSIEDFHKSDDVNAMIECPYRTGTFESLLYVKNWIDTVQWHLEDIIRQPDIDPEEGMSIKRRIDKSNQDRTDMVEKIDDFFISQFNHVSPRSDARMNSETPAWLLDRMSILMLKIYHMKEQTARKDVDAQHIEKCKVKLNILLEQKSDMQLAFDELLEDIGDGKRRFKVYRQMKMYNDASLNPALYGNKSKA
ncbi:MAG: DUF4254 domain-containing protein [Cyclobacteriaceae bacterium]|nr:DUF4254 domain-containing protein [Cyclobacteriaceae bacterium]MDH4294922.1 DUF4254 domain-containing protein [Cyclobacteriaceae bacterium]MDH5249361.1 DUF4254 domain-containing protein [Cyclobacteriaceae bacterium]